MVKIKVVSMLEDSKGSEFTVLDNKGRIWVYSPTISDVPPFNITDYHWIQMELPDEPMEIIK